jgi:hypothetical protein
MKSLLSLLLLFTGYISFAQQNDTATTAKLQKILAARYVKVPPENRRFIYNEVDLNDDGKNEVLVGLIGMEFCGSGGCTMLVLNKDYKVVTSITLVKYPVYVGAPGGKEVTKGYSNLYIYTGGVGLVKMTWNGKSYPTNPSLQPAAPASLVKGKFEFLKATDQATYNF